MTESNDESTMPAANKSWPLSSVLLALAGMTLVGAGLYFLFLRPPLLPEDIRYMGLSAAELDAALVDPSSLTGPATRGMDGYFGTADDGAIADGTIKTLTLKWFKVDLTPQS
jgi:hypothetical protein